VVVLLFCFFYGVPLVLDFLVGQPEYIAFPGFREPAWSAKVAVAYDLFVIACPVFWWLTASRKRIKPGKSADLSGLRKIRYLLWILLISPIFTVAFAPEPGFYAHYGAVLTPSFTPAIERFHLVVGESCLLSAVAGFALLISQRRVALTFLQVLPFFILSSWITGKRSDAFLVVVLMWIALWVRGKITPPVLIAGGLATGAALFFYSSWYQNEFRPLTVSDSQRAYEMFRVDYGRDQDLRTALYCEMTSNRRILSYRGESLVFDLTMVIPRSVWPQKPMPYSIYMAAAGLYTKPRFFGWSVTTSILDEAIANFSWLGLVIGPFVLTVICWIGDRADPLGKSLSVLIACMLLTMDAAGFAPLVLCWLLYLAWSRWSTRSRPEIKQFRYVPAPRAVQGL
jgi:hypothetical protein